MALREDIFKAIARTRDGEYGKRAYGAASTARHLARGIRDDKSAGLSYYNEALIETAAACLAALEAHNTEGYAPGIKET